MRQQLEEINTDRQELRKMLREQNSLLEKTNKNIVAISRSLQDVRDSKPTQKVILFIFILLDEYLKDSPAGKFISDRGDLPK